MGPFEAPTPHAADREETRAEAPPRAGNGGRPVARRNADRRGARGRPLLAGVRGKEAKRIAVTLSQGGRSAKCVLRGAAFAGKPRGASQGEEAPSGQRPAGAQTRGDEEEEPAGREVAVGAGGGPRAAGHLRTCPPGRGPFCHRGRAPSRHAGATGHVVPVHAPKWGVSPSEENALSEMTTPLKRERANPAHGEDVPPRRCVRRCVWVGSSGPSFIAKRTGTVRPRARGAVSVRVRPPGGAVGSKMCGRSSGNAACGPSFLTWGGWGSPNRCHPRIDTGLLPPALRRTANLCHPQLGSFMSLGAPSPSVRVTQPGASPQETGERPSEVGVEEGHMRHGLHGRGNSPSE